MDQDAHNARRNPTTPRMLAMWTEAHVLMATWKDTIDPSTIPDEVLHSEVGKRRAAKRKTFGFGRNGGRPRKVAPEPDVTTAKRTRKAGRA
jgi:hypothetical protein